jgi:hypothetical protein
MRISTFIILCIHLLRHAAFCGRDWRCFGRAFTSSVIGKSHGAVRAAALHFLLLKVGGGIGECAM